jgi:hypothetical protein
MYEDGIEFYVPKYRHIKFRRRGITQKKEYKHRTCFITSSGVLYQARDIKMAEKLHLLTQVCARVRMCVIFPYQYIAVLYTSCVVCYYIYETGDKNTFYAQYYILTIMTLQVHYVSLLSAYSKGSSKEGGVAIT